jgi:hypothetical protein
MLRRGIRWTRPLLAYPALTVKVQSDAERAEAEAFAKSAAANSPLRLPVTNRSEFFFRGGNVCRLCGCKAEVPKDHFTLGVEARYHTMREVLVDLLVPYCKAGMHPDAVAETWPGRLLAHDAYFRIPSLVPTTGGLIARSEALHSLLKLLRSLGVLDSALAPARRVQGDLLSPLVTKRSRNVVEFERLEYIGDAMWGSETQSRIMLLFPGKDWMSSGSAWAFGILRDNIESNVNLATLYDCLRIGDLLPKDVILGGDKPQADIMEAIAGALQLYVIRTRGTAPATTPIDVPFASGHGTHTISHVAQHALAELVDLAVLLFLHQLLPPLIPMVREFALGEVVPSTLPPVCEAPQLPPVWMVSRRLRRHGTQFSFVNTKLHPTTTAAATGVTQPNELAASVGMGKVRATGFVDESALAYRLHGEEDLPEQIRRYLGRQRLGEQPRRAPRDRVSAVDHATARAMAMTAPPRMATEDEMMLARMHPLNSPFAVNTGYVPGIVERAERAKAALQLRKRRVGKKAV